MSVSKKLTEAEYVKMLAEAGFTDAIILEKEDIPKALTDERLELLETIDEKQIESMRDLARKVDRDPAAVKRDLDTLFEYDLIEFEEKNGKKIPKKKYEHIFVEPVL